MLGYKFKLLKHMRRNVLSFIVLFCLSGFLSWGGTFNNNILQQHQGYAKTNTSGYTQFFNNRSQKMGSAEKAASGTITFYGRANNKVGTAVKKSNGDVFVYDNNSRKLGTLNKADSDWINTVFWLYFQK